MINETLIFVGRVFYEWYAEIIAVLIGAVLVWVLGLLPSRFQYHKRLNFALKVKKAVSKIDVSVQTRKHINISDLQKEFKKFFAENSIEEIKASGNELTFFSNETGGNYVISSTNDLEIDKYFVIVSCLNAFNIGRLGGIKGLRDITNELQEILDSFGNMRKDKDSLTVQINITPRWNFLQDNGITVHSKGKNVETSYRIKSIKLVNKGTANLRENIDRVFYNWLVSLL